MYTPTTVSVKGLMLMMTQGRVFTIITVCACETIPKTDKWLQVIAVLHSASAQLTSQMSLILITSYRDRSTLLQCFHTD